MTTYAIPRTARAERFLTKLIGFIDAQQENLDTLLACQTEPQHWADADRVADILKVGTVLDAAKRVATSIRPFGNDDDAVRMVLDSLSEQLQQDRLTDRNGVQTERLNALSTAFRHINSELWARS